MIQHRKTKKRVFRYNDEPLYKLSKTALGELVSCALKHFLIRWFRPQIPHNIYSTTGLIVHDMAKKLWKKRGKWKSSESFAKSASGRLLRTFKTRLLGLDGKPAKDSKGKAIWGWQSRPRIQGRPIVFPEDQEEKDKLFWWGYWKVFRCARNMAERFLGTPKPLDERSIRFAFHGLFLEIRYDLVFPRPSDAPLQWIIGEWKTGLEAESTWEKALLSVGWAFLVRKPGFAKFLNVPPEIVAELTQNPLAVFKYVRIQYFYLDAEYEEITDPKLHEPQRSSPGDWLEFRKAARHWQYTALRGEGGEIPPTNRRHCFRCEAKAICDVWLPQQMTHAAQQIKLFDTGLLLPEPRKTPGPDGLVYELNLRRDDKIARSEARKSTKAKWEKEEEVGGV